jgi:hypothetical protein
VFKKHGLPGVPELAQTPRWSQVIIRIAVRMKNMWKIRRRLEDCKVFRKEIGCACIVALGTEFKQNKVLRTSQFFSKREGLFAETKLLLALGFKLEKRISNRHSITRIEEHFF